MFTTTADVLALILDTTHPTNDMDAVRAQIAADGKAWAAKVEARNAARPDFSAFW